VLHGTARVKESVSSEKPSPASIFEAGRGTLLTPGSHIAGEASGATFITALIWPKTLWEYALQVPSTREKCSLMLSIGTEGPSHQTPEELCSVLHGVPILQHVPSKILKECILPHVRVCSFADLSIISTEGEDDFTLYIIVKGTVLLYEDKDSEDPLLCAGLRGLDTLRTSIGNSTYELSVGDCFGQMEVMLQSSNSFTAVCKGPSEVLLVGGGAILDNVELASMIWLCIDNAQRAGSRQPDSYAEAEPTRMHQELQALRTYHHAKTHKICEGLSERSAIFMCTHMQTRLLSKEDGILVRSVSSGPQATSIAAVVTGQLAVHPVVTPAAAPAKPTLGSVLCSLRAGDMYDPHLAKIDEPSFNPDTKLDQVRDGTCASVRRRLEFRVFRMIECCCCRLRWLGRIRSATSLMPQSTELQSRKICSHPPPLLTLWLWSAVVRFDLRIPTGLTGQCTHELSYSATRFSTILASCARTFPFLF